MNLNFNLGSRRSKDKKELGVVGKAFWSLFCLMFFVPGMLIAGWSFWDAAVHMDMKGWNQVAAKVISVDLKANHDSEGGTTYKTLAQYSYTYEGRDYTGERTSIYDSMSDNIGSFHQDLYDDIQSERSRNNGWINIFVDPDNPAEAVISRDFRTGLFFFKFIFGLIFASVGGGMLYAIWLFNPKPKHRRGLSEHEAARNPWLDNTSWQTADIKCDAKWGMWGAVGFATIWMLISIPTGILCVKEYHKTGDLAPLIGLLFPLVGLVLTAYAAKAVMQYRRFGPLLLRMDPFPGSLDGHVGGTVDLRHRFDSNLQFTVTLSNNHSYISGSGKNRSRRTRTNWSQKVLAYAEPSMEGTRLSFRFSPPTDMGLKEAEAERGESYTVWYLNISCEMPGVDLDRTYDIPVYLTGQQSRSISERNLEVAAAKTQDFNEMRVDAVLPLGHGLNGQELFYPVFRNKAAALGGVIVGGIFVAAAYFMQTHLRDEQDIPTWFIAVFGIVGSLIVISSIYSITNSLRVYSDGSRLISVRRVLGVLRFQSSIPLSEITNVIKKRTSSQQHGNGKTKEYYKIQAVGHVQGKKRQLTMAEGIEGGDAADLARDRLIDAFRIQLKNSEN